MGMKNRLLVLCLITIFLSGSLVLTEDNKAALPEPETVIEALLMEQEEELKKYALELKQAGEELFAEKLGELRRAHMQAMHDEAKRLRFQAEDKLKELEAKLGGDMLRQQLQLMLVTLDEDQRQARLKVMEQLQGELAAAQVDLEAELQEQLLQLEAEYEARSQGEAARLLAEVEQALEEELADFRRSLFQDLARSSRSALANR